MAVYPNMLTTVAGFNLIARSNATGKALIFTRGALGDGDASDKTITSLTNLVAPKMPNLSITNKRDNGNGHFTIEASVDNSTLEAGFWAREMGVFAKCEGDETDVLYAYTNGGNLVPYVNDKTMPDIQLMQLDVIIGNAKNLSVTIDTSVYITEARMITHDEAPDAHKIAFDKFRLDSNGLYVPKIGGAITGDLDVQGNLSVITQTLEDYGVNAANTKWVQDFVKNYVGSSGAVRASYGETGFRVFNDGFCIQWVACYGVNNRSNIYWPIAFSIYSAVACDMGSDMSNPLTYRITLRNDCVNAYAERNNGIAENTIWSYIIAIGSCK